MEYHPLSEVAPMMEGEAFDQFKEDIRISGLKEPIRIYDGKILDGRNRYKACQELGIEIKTKIWKGDDPLSYVLSMNVHRRHLSQSQLGIIAARMANLPKGGQLKTNAPTGAFTQRKAAKAVGTTRRTTQRGAVVLKYGDKDLIKEVEQGKTTLSKALNMIGDNINTDKKEIDINNEDHYMGKIFNGIEVKSFVESIKKRKMYLCVCRCGNEFIVNVYALKGGKIQSCGCKRKRSGQPGRRKYKNSAYIPTTEHQLLYANKEKTNLETVIYQTAGLFEYFSGADIPMVKSVSTLSELKHMYIQLTTLASQLNLFRKLLKKEVDENGNSNVEGYSRILQQEEIAQGSS